MRWSVLLGFALGCRFGFDSSPAVDATPDVPDPAPADYCARIPALAGPPTIDGAVEPGLRMQTLIPVGWQDTGDVPAAIVDVPVQLAIAYRPDGLYFVVDVRDPDRFPAPPACRSYCGDAVELYVDHDGDFPSAPAYDAAGAIQLIARAPATATMPRSEGDSFVNRSLQGLWQGGYATFPTATGYVLEAFIDANTLGLASWSLVAGGRVGIDLSLNVSRPDGALVPIGECAENQRIGQFFLRVDDSMAGMAGEGAPFWTTTAFCTAQLE